MVISRHSFSKRKSVHCSIILTHILLYIKLSIKAIEKHLLFQHFTQIFIYLEVFFILEPFGLLKFLQTALSLADFSQNPPSGNAENKPASAPSFTPSNNPEKENMLPVEQSKNAPQTENFSSSQNAFSQFMSAHDARVKKTKR